MSGVGTRAADQLKDQGAVVVVGDHGKQVYSSRWRFAGGIDRIVVFTQVVITYGLRARLSFYVVRTFTAQMTTSPMPRRKEQVLWYVMSQCSV